MNQVPREPRLAKGGTSSSPPPTPPVPLAGDGGCFAGQTVVPLPYALSPGALLLNEG